MAPSVTQAPSAKGMCGGETTSLPGREGKWLGAEPPKSRGRGRAAGRPGGREADGWKVV